MPGRASRRRGPGLPSFLLQLGTTIIACRLARGATSMASAYVDDGMFAPWKLDPFGRNGTGSLRTRQTVVGGQVDRKLQFYRNSDTCGVAPNPDPCCIRCLELTKCWVLNHKYIEDMYTPRTDTTGSCLALEDAATRLDVFGEDKTFRDTDMCRDLVYQYTCLWWASESSMYSNRCDSCCSNIDLGVPLRPCRQYCFQIANLCANNVDYQDLCERIPCPPSDTTCDIGYYTDTSGYTDPCYLYTYKTPAAFSSAPTHMGPIYALQASLVLALSITLLFA